jgi:AAA ATPase domain
MQLLEREAPGAALAEYAADARGGDGRLVLVAGEAGVGKSALVEQLQRDMPDARWSWGACDGVFTPRPLVPLFDLADQLGGDLLDLCQARAAREELFRALLRQISQPGRLDVVVLEDIHWADEATIDLLRFLGRRIRDAGLLLIATYRDDGLAASDPLRLALGDLSTQRSTRRVRLAPLTGDAVRVLADGTGLEAAALYRLTGGNPFYVTEVLQAGVDRVPDSARDAVLARAAHLSDESREVLEVAAMAGTRVELRLLAAVTGCPPAAVDELLASGLLSGDGRWLRFRHEIARLAVQQAIPAHRRGDLHRRILAVLLDLGGGDDAQLAADGTGEPQSIVPVRLTRAEARWLEGRPAEARREAELAAESSAGSDPWMRGGLAVWLRRTGSDRFLPGELAEPYQCSVDGDWKRAAELWTSLGCPYEAALALADGPGEDALRDALTILDGLGATATARLTPAENAHAGLPVDPSRPTDRDPGAPARPDPPRAGGPRPDLRRAQQRGDRREAVHLSQDR